MQLVQRSHLARPTIQENNCREGHRRFAGHEARGAREQVDEIGGREEIAPIDEDAMSGEVHEDRLEQEPEADREAAASNDQRDAGVEPPPEPHPEPRRGRRVRALPWPIQLTKAQREEHELTHLPFAAWCRHCVVSRSQNDPRRRKKKHGKNEEALVMSGDFVLWVRTTTTEAARYLL